MKPAQIIYNVFPVSKVQWPPKVVRTWCIQNPLEHGLIYHAGDSLYFFQVKEAAKV